MVGKIPRERPFADNHVPYYYQIASLLRRKIELGELPPGLKLPREVDLAKIYNVSRVPIRQALSLLAADGLILRGRGSGTFVRRDGKRPKTTRLTGVIEGNTNPGRTYRLLSLEEVRAVPQLVDFFGSSAGDRVTLIQRIPMLGKKPFAYARHFLPTQIARQIGRADLRKKSMLEIITSRMGIRVGKVIQTIEARVADNEVAPRLSIKIMAPVLYVETFVRREQGEPVEFSQIFFRGDQHKYLVERVPM